MQVLPKLLYIIDNEYRIIGYESTNTQCIKEEEGGI